MALLLWAQPTAGAIFLGLALSAQLEAAAAGQLEAAAPDRWGPPSALGYAPASAAD